MECSSAGVKGSSSNEDLPRDLQLHQRIIITYYSAGLLLHSNFCTMARFFVFALLLYKTVKF